jgi:hypothetical protein
MAVTNETRPRPVTGAESEFDRASRTMPRPEVRVNQTNNGSNGVIAYLIAALVIVVGGYYVYTSYYAPTAPTPAATQSSTTLPKSDTVVPVTPVPATPPAESTATPPAEPPATAPAAPVTPPAATTTP